MTTMSFKLPDLSLQHGIAARIWDTHTRSPPSPGSSVHSSRGALREMPLRFLRTLLMTFPTPPDPEPAGCCCCRDLTYALDRRPAGMKRSCLIGYGVRTNHHPMCPLCGPRYTTFWRFIAGCFSSWKTRPFLTVFNRRNRSSPMPINACDRCVSSWLF